MSSEQNEDSIRESDIRVSEIRQSEIRQSESTLTPKNESSHSQSFLRKILIVTIVVVVLLGITVGIVIVVNKKKEKPDEPEPIDETIIEPPKNDSNVIVNINRKLHQVLIYEDTTSKRQNILLKGQSNASSRRLDEMFSSTSFTSKYMFYIYEIEESHDTKTYHAYAFLLSFKKEGEDDLIVNFKNVNEINSNTPMLKVSFYNNGTIEEVNAPDNSNITLISYLHEFLEKIIPDVAKKTDEDLSKNYTFDKTNNVTKLNISKNSLFGNNEDSQETKTFEINVKEGNIDNVRMTKRSILSNSQNYNFKDNSNFTAEVEGDNTRLIKSLIKEFNEYIDSDLTLSNDSYEDEHLSEKIHSFIKDLDFNHYEKILSNFNKKLKDGNENNKFKRHLNTDIFDPYYQPIIFTYPLFKANFLGANIGLYSKITFLPTLGLFKFDVIFNKHGEEINIMNEERYVNFDEIIDTIDQVIKHANNLITDNILMDIKKDLDEVKNQLDNELNKLYLSIDKVPDFSNCMVNSYEKLYDLVLEANSKSFEQVISNSKKCKNTYDGIFTAINESQNENINNILKSSEDEFNKFITETVDKADIIFSQSTSFFPQIVKHLDYLISEKFDPEDELEFDICTFYDIRDILDNIYNIFNNFETQVKNAIENENFTFYTYIDDEFEKNIEIYLKKVEYFADRMENNNSIIQALNKYYENSEENGNEIRLNSIDTIRGLRNKINEMIKLIIQQIYDVYEEKINGDNSDVKSIFNTFKEQYEDIYKNGTALMKKLREQVKFDENYTIYLNDINTIFEIYYNIAETKRKSYKEKIIDKLNAIGNDYLNKEKEGIKNLLTNDLREIVMKIKELHYQEAKDKVYNLMEENGTLDIILKVKLESDIKKIVINKYSNENFLKGLLNNFYSDVTKEYNEFNYTYLNINFKKHSSSYMARPTEAERKLRQIKVKAEKEGELLFEKLTLYIIECINRTIKEAYESVYNTWNELINSIFYEQVPKNVYGYSGDNKTDYEAVEEEIEKARQYLYSNIEKDKDNYRRTVKDQFKIQKLIETKQNEIDSNLGKIINSLEIFFNQNLCIAHEISCKNGNPENLLSSLQQYQFQVAKTRESISDLNSLIPKARSMLGDEILNSLNPNDFSELYKRGFNYEAKDLIKDIKDFLDELNKVTREYMKSYVTNIQTELMNSFSKSINFDGLQKEIENIALEIFVDPLPFKKEVHKFMNMGCGPIARVKQIYNDEMNYYSNKKSYYFEPEKYAKHFEQLLQKIDESYNYESENFLKGIKVSQNIKKEVYDKIEKFIDNGINKLKNEINDYELKFEFLDMDYDLNDIITDIMGKEEKNLKEKVNEEIDSKYDYYLELLVLIIRNNLEAKYKDIMAMMKTSYNSAFAVYSNANNVSSTFKLDKLEDSTYETFLNVVTDFFAQMKKIYTENSIMKEVGDAQKVRLEQFNESATYIGLINSIKENLDSFEKASINRYTQEKLSFSSNIVSIIVKGYNITLDSFISKAGKDYINGNYDSENEINIKPEFDLLNMTIDNSYDYINSLLNTSELSFISKTLADRLKNIFGNINSIINEILPPKINSVINQKLDKFSDNVEYLIPTNFIDKIIDIITSKNFKNTLNKPKVQILIPNSFSDGFKANLTTIFSSKLNIDGYKNNFKKQMTDKLNEISNQLKLYNKQMSLTVGSKAQTINSNSMNLIRKDYENFEKYFNNYKEIYNLPVGQLKKDSFTRFLVDEIYTNLKHIIDSFEKEKKEQENNITNAINSFSAEGVVNNVEMDLSNTNISLLIATIDKDLTIIMNNLANSMGEKFDNIGKELKNSFNTPLTGFNFKQQRRMRNLQSEKYNLKQINEALDKLQEKYNNFRDEVLTNQNFVFVYTKIGSMKKSLNNSANHISEYFYSYQLLLSDYIDPIIALNKIENEADKIKQYLYNWLTTQTGGIGKTVESIKDRVTNSWKEAKTKIDVSLTRYFNDIFNFIFSGINNLKTDYPISGNQLSPDIKSIYLYNNKGEVILTINTILNNLDLTYKYDFQRVNVYDFNVILESSGKFNATFDIITADGSYVNTIKDVLGSGVFSVNPKYNLYDKSVEATIKIKNEAAKYTSIMKVFNETEKQYFDEAIEVYEFAEIDDIGWVNVYKNTP